MARNLKVSVNSMRGDSARIQDLIDQLPGLVGELDTAMQRLGSCWEGYAWDTFQKQVASDVNNMNDMYRFLANYISHIETGAQYYLEAEQDAYSDAKGIWI